MPLARLVITCGLSLTLGGKCRIEGGADGCWIGAELPGDGTRHGRPAGRAALARSGRWARGAGEYQPVRLVGPLLGRPAVGDGAIRERASTHREHAPGAQPSVKVGLHDPEYRQPRNDCCGRPCSAHRPRQGGQIILAATRGPYRTHFGRNSGNSGLAAPVAGRRSYRGSRNERKDATLMLTNA